MGFWSNFGKYAGMAGAAVAAPFSGGASLAAMPALSQIGTIAGAVAPVIGGLAEGRSQGKQQEAINTRQALLDEFRSKIEANKLAAERPELRAEQARKGDLLANVQDVGVNASPEVMKHLVSFTGGKRPSALGPNAREAGRLMSDQALGYLKNGEDLPTAPSAEAMLAPTKSGVLDKILGAAGPAMSLLGTVPPVARTMGGTQIPSDPNAWKNVKFGPTQAPPGQAAAQFVNGQLMPAPARRRGFQGVTF